jgi:hypothetical protein
MIISILHGDRFMIMSVLHEDMIKTISSKGLSYN